MPNSDDLTPVQRCAGFCLSQLAGFVPNGVRSASARDGSVEVTVTVVPLADVRRPGHEYTPSERTILTLIASSPGPLTRPQLMEELERRGHLYGESTVGHSLARLVKRGAIVCSRKPPRGYSVRSEVPSLFQQID